jgi:hypothetical protein
MMQIDPASAALILIKKRKPLKINGLVGLPSGCPQDSPQRVWVNPQAPFLYSAQPSEGLSDDWGNDQLAQQTDAQRYF